MSTKSIVNIIIVLITVVFISCEKEKIEYKKQHSGDFFTGFVIRSNFIIHDESISYYNADSNKVFSNLFEHQNGRKLGNSVHSLKFFRNWKDDYGIITVEGENMIEIVDKNFISVKQIPLYKPRNISIAGNSFNEFILISFGDAEHGGIAVFAPWDFTIVDSVRTGNTAGNIYVHDYIYVSSNGENDTDSTIAKIYYGGNSYSLQKVDDIVVGKRPVISFSFNEYETGYSNQCILIHCLGNSTESPKIVLYDLVRDEILDTFYPNQNIDFPEHILDFNFFKRELIYKSNSKIYSATLQYLESPELIGDRNIKSLKEIYVRDECRARDSLNNCLYTGSTDYYVGVSDDVIDGQRFLYRFNEDYPKKDFFELIDSIPIGPDAKKIIVGWP